MVARGQVLCLLVVVSALGSCSSDSAEIEQEKIRSLVPPLSGGFPPNQPRTQQEKPLEPAETKRRRIVFITAIFGQATQLLPFFLKSAEKSGIDVLIFGDVVPTQKLPSNVLHVGMTWRQMLKRVHDKVPECFANSGEGWMKSMGVKRKIIDFKPLYATILEDEIKDYWMWGYGDNDLLLGDVRKFLTDNVTSSYHVIPLHHDSSDHFAFGPATFFKNDPRVNNLFRRRYQLCEMLTDRRAYGFDEWFTRSWRVEGEALDHIIHNELKNGSLGLRAFEWPYPQIFWDRTDTAVEPVNVNMVCELRCDEAGPCHTIRQCSAPAHAKCTRAETALCHFQKTKKQIGEKLLKMSQHELSELLSSDVMFASAEPGFYRPSEQEMREAEARGLSLDGREAEWVWVRKGRRRPARSQNQNERRASAIVGGQSEGLKKRGGWNRQHWEKREEGTDSIGKKGKKKGKGQKRAVAWTRMEKERPGENRRR